MQCASCGHVNPYSVSFCESCGSQFPGQDLPPPRPVTSTPFTSAPRPAPFGGVYSTPTPVGYSSTVTLPSRTSGMAIAGLICSFLCGILGLILSIIAYRECQSDEVDGEGMALVGIFISIANMVLGMLVQLSH